MDSQDRDLIERARRGDPHARETLVTRFAPVVLRWARADCRDPRDGEDVAQEVLLAAARNLHQVEAPEAFPRWLRAVTHHQCQRYRRLRAGAPRTFEELAESADPSAAPDELAGRDEAHERLARALAALDPVHREVIVLRDMEGLTAPEVAALLSISVDAVKSRLHRARSALRDALSPPVRRPGCPEIALRYSEYLEGDLDGTACDVLHEHVAQCSSCDAACKALSEAVGACRTMVRPTAEVVARVQSALRAIVDQ